MYLKKQLNEAKSFNNIYLNKTSFKWEKLDIWYAYNQGITNYYAKIRLFQCKVLLTYKIVIKRNAF